ncbi:MAG: enoyl-CoA hydratase [Gammaproteobacteria bacterium]|nr:MAG: enoyl-CoA hydratase [Gammaproteobacteria bacterium]RLA53212.1 MAG: enoyl-CoA hydratase [Gammaproteobacteria bacterium]
MMAHNNLQTSKHPADNGIASCRIETRQCGGEVAQITVEHVGKMNSIGSAMIADLMTIFADLKAREMLRVVVIRGAGERAFVGGAFLPELEGLTPQSGRKFIIRLHLVCQAVRDCPVPVIARMQGYCLGAGTELAASCDFRVADRSVIFGMPEVKVGLPSVIEAALLPMLIGWGKTREMLLTSANYDADEGQAMGFIETLVDMGKLDEAVELRVNQIVSAGPLAVRAQKELINAWESMTPSEGTLLGIDYLAAAYETDEPQRMMAPLLKK